MKIISDFYFLFWNFILWWNSMKRRDKMIWWNDSDYSFSQFIERLQEYMFELLFSIWPDYTWSDFSREQSCTTHCLLEYWFYQEWTRYWSTLVKSLQFVKRNAPENVNLIFNNDSYDSTCTILKKSHECFRITEKNSMYRYPHV